MTSATVRVEKATSDLLIAPDWSLNIDICDSANSDYAQAKEVIKAVKKRLHHKSPKVQFLTLTLLETLMKNCGDYVHQQVSEREILQDLVKIVKKKSDFQVRDKILTLLDAWQEAFGGPHGKFPQYYLAFAELKGAGVIFPERSSDDPPILTPPATHFSPSPYPSPSSFPLPTPPPQAIYNPDFPQPGFHNPGFGNPGFPQPGFGNPGFGNPGFGNPGFGRPGFGRVGVGRVGVGMPAGASVRLDEAMASDRVNLSSLELERMRSVMELLSDMLRAVNPNDPAVVRDDEVISELVEQCRSNEKKLMAFITSTQDEQLLEQSLELNDKLQTLLSKHDSIASGSAAAPPPVASASHEAAPPVASAPHEAAISGASVVPPPVASVATTSGAGEEEEEDDDEFAQLARRSSKQKAISDNGSGSNNPLSLPDPPAPIKTSQNREEEMINLLNSSLSLYPPNLNEFQIQNQNQNQNPAPTFQATSPMISSPNYPSIQNPNLNPNQFQIQNPITSPTFQATSPVINSPNYPIQNPNQIQYQNSPTFRATSPVINSPNYPSIQNQNPSPITSPTFQATSPIINSPSYPIENPIPNQNQNQIPSQITSPTFQATRPTINSPTYPIPNPNQPQFPNPNQPQFPNPNQFQIPNHPQIPNPNQFQWAPPDTSSYPPPPWASEPDPAPNSSSNSNSYSNSIGLNGPGAPPGAPPRPSYISSSTFFGDLVELRNPDGSLRAGPAGVSGLGFKK